MDSLIQQTRGFLPLQYRRAFKDTERKRVPLLSRFQYSLQIKILGEEPVMFSDGRKAHLDDIHAKVVAAGTTAATSAGVQGHPGGLVHCVTPAKLPPAAFSSGFEALETLRWSTARLWKLPLVNFNPPWKRRKKKQASARPQQSWSGTAGAGRAPGTRRGRRSREGFSFPQPRRGSRTAGNNLLTTLSN